MPKAICEDCGSLVDAEITHNGVCDVGHYVHCGWGHMFSPSDLISDAAADRIKELEEHLKAAIGDAKEAEAYAVQMEVMLESAEQQGYANAMEAERKLHEGRIEELEAKLAACEKYRDAYAEMDRIGTEAVHDLEAKLAKAVEALGVLIQLAHDCEKELTEELHRQDFCGESLPLTNARATLAELKGEK